MAKKLVDLFVIETDIYELNIMMGVKIKKTMIILFNIFDSIMFVTFPNSDIYLCLMSI